MSNTMVAVNMKIVVCIEGVILLRLVLLLVRARQ